MNCNGSILVVNSDKGSYLVHKAKKTGQPGFLLYGSCRSLFRFLGCHRRIPSVHFLIILLTFNPCCVCALENVNTVAQLTGTERMVHPRHKHGGGASVSHVVWPPIPVARSHKALEQGAVSLHAKTRKLAEHGGN